MYAKLINNRLQPAPKQVRCNGNTVFNPPPDILVEMGYLPVQYTDMPADAPEGYHYESSWNQTEAEILQVWQLAEE